MRGMASSYRQQELPASLVQRLALLQHLALEANAQAAGQTHGELQVARAPRARAQVIVLAWFSLGVLVSGAIGAGAIVGLRALASGATPMAWDAWARTPTVVSAPQPEGEWETFQVAIDRSEQAHARLALQVKGADDASIEVVLQDLPVGVRPSRGELRGGATWVLKQADLDDLYLELGDAAPEAFEVRIGVLAPPGVATVGSVVHVRLVDAVPQKQAAVTDSPDAALRPAYQGMSDGPVTDVAKSAAANESAAAPTLSARGDGKAGATPARRGAEPAAVATTVPAVQPSTAARSWPEGASALGAMPREPERQVWWEVPPPSWSPFQDGRDRP